jgi:peptide/nickel transport system permease protein
MSRFALASLVFLAVMMSASLLAPVISPYDPQEMHASDRDSPPNEKYLLGTDMFGRDILSRILWGARVSFYVAAAAVIVACVFGIPVGAVTGYRPGKLGNSLMVLNDVLLSFPAVILALLLIAVLGPGVENLIIALGVVYIPRFVRIARAAVLSQKDLEYVQAAKAAGDSETRILVAEILPNALAPLIINATIFFAFAILDEAAFSFLGLGVQPPRPSWGNMLYEARGYIELAPWMSIIPGIFIGLTVLALNLLGDGLRDALDPRLRVD